MSNPRPAWTLAEQARAELGAASDLARLDRDHLVAGLLNKRIDAAVYYASWAIDLATEDNDRLALGLLDADCRRRAATEDDVGVRSVLLAIAKTVEEAP